MQRTVNAVLLQASQEGARSGEKTRARKFYYYLRLQLSDRWSRLTRVSQASSRGPNRLSFATAIDGLLSLKREGGATEVLGRFRLRPLKGHFCGCLALPALYCGGRISPRRRSPVMPVLMVN